MPRLAYISFDAVPAAKGASTHIQAFTSALGQSFGPIELVTVGASDTRIELWTSVFHTELPALGTTLIDRALCFRTFLKHWLASREFDVIQFRSIFEGLPLLARSHRCKLIFEVNGLPSIELKYRYPGIEDDRELMRKLVSQEQACLEAAHLIVTPSAVTGDYLTSSRAADASKIRVIPNGVDLCTFQPENGPAQRRPFRLIYFGTLASWQGVDLAIRALEQVRRKIEAELTIIGPGSSDERQTLMTLAAKLKVAGCVQLLPAMTQLELARHLNASHAALAPLTLNDRNIVQGCCPLKILEAMAAATPVIASDLPVVREIGCDGEHLLLVKPGSVDQLAQAILRLAENSQLALAIGTRARQHVVRNFTWKCSGDALIQAYEEVGNKRARTA